MGGNETIPQPRPVVFAFASEYLISSSRPWECGNPEGISKECGKGGKPASWLSMLSILLSFPWPALETRFTKSQSPRRPVLGTGTTCPRCRLFGQVVRFPSSFPIYISRRASIVCMSLQLTPPSVERTDRQKNRSWEMSEKIHRSQRAL